MEKRIGKNGDKLGTGMVEGVAAAEAGNNGAAAGAFAPLLSLGIPGSGTGAVLLGGLLMYGLNPGPRLFQTQPDFTWGVIASLYIANIITLGVALLIVALSYQNTEGAYQDHDPHYYNHLYYGQLQREQLTVWHYHNAYSRRCGFLYEEIQIPHRTSFTGLCSCSHNGEELPPGTTDFRRQYAYLPAETYFTGSGRISFNHCMLSAYPLGNRKDKKST